MFTTKARKDENTKKTLVPGAGQVLAAEGEGLYRPGGVSAHEGCDDAQPEVSESRLLR